jgi:hypothetical protein
MLRPSTARTDPKAFSTPVMEAMQVMVLRVRTPGRCR